MLMAIATTKEHKVGFRASKIQRFAGFQLALIGQEYACGHNFQLQKPIEVIYEFDPTSDYSLQFCTRTYNGSLNSANEYS